MFDIDKFLLDRKLLREKNREKWTQKIIKLQRRIDALNDEESENRRIRMRAQRFINRLNKFEPMLLEAWFLHDSWTKHEAFLILCDLDPMRSKPDLLNHLRSGLYKGGFPAKVAIRLDNLDYGSMWVKEILGKSATVQVPNTIREKYEKLEKLWESSVFSENRYAPLFFLNWAISKKIKVNWIDWILEKELISKKQIDIKYIDFCLVNNLPPEASAPAPLPVAHLNLSGGEARVPWRILVEERIGEIDEIHGGKASVLQVMRWLKKNGGKRIVDDDSIDDLHWIDDNLGRQVVLKKTISTATSKARASRKPVG